MAATITQLAKEIKNGIEYGIIRADFTNAQVKGLGTATILISAPGTTKMIIVEKVIYTLVFASSAFATSTNVNIIADTATVAQWLVDISGGASITTTKPAANPGGTCIANKALVAVTDDAVNPTAGGTSTISLEISYRIKNV